MQELSELLKQVDRVNENERTNYELESENEKLEQLFYNDFIYDFNE